MSSVKSMLTLSLTTTAMLQGVRPADSFAYVDQPNGGYPKARRSNIPEETAPKLSLSDGPDPALLVEHASFASKLADAARTEILPFWRQSRHALGQQIKIESDRSVFQSASPVTLADRAAERAMRDLISERYPHHGIYGEEYGVVREDADWVWVLDPIDGTRSFITGKPLFGTLISCLYRGSPVVGVIDQCVLEERWIGVAGQKSTLNGRVIETDGVSKLSDAEMYSTTPDMFKQGFEYTRYDAMRNAVRTPHYGADCYAYALVASGFGADVVVEADLGLYDYCALVPVLEGAGGVISDWTGDKLTLQNHEKSCGRVVASANSALHLQALQILNPSSPPANASAFALESSSENNEEILSSSPSEQIDLAPWLFGAILGDVVAHLT